MLGTDNHLWSSMGAASVLNCWGSLSSPTTLLSGLLETGPFTAVAKSSVYEVPNMGAMHCIFNRFQLTIVRISKNQMTADAGKVVEEEKPLLTVGGSSIPVTHIKSQA